MLPNRKKNYVVYLKAVQTYISLVYVRKTVEECQVRGEGSDRRTETSSSDDRLVREE